MPSEYVHLNRLLFLSNSGFSHDSSVVEMDMQNSNNVSCWFVCFLIVVRLHGSGCNTSTTSDGVEDIRASFIIRAGPGCFHGN